MIQKPAGAVLMQFYPLLWFTHMSLILRNFKGTQRKCCTLGVPRLSVCKDTALKPTRNQHKRTRCGIQLLAGFVPVSAQPKPGIPHVPFLSSSTEGELWAMEPTLAMESLSRPDLWEAVSTFHQHASYCLANGPWKGSTIFQYFFPLL